MLFKFLENNEMIISPKSSQCHIALIDQCGQKRSYHVDLQYLCFCCVIIFRRIWLTLPSSSTSPPSLAHPIFHPPPSLKTMLVWKEDRKISKVNSTLYCIAPLGTLDYPVAIDNVYNDWLHPGIEWCCVRMRTWPFINILSIPIPLFTLKFWQKEE